AAAEARAPDAEPLGVDLRLQRQPCQSAAVVLDLVAGGNPLAWLTAAAAEEAMVEHERRDARFCESPGERLEIHLLHCTDAVRHGHGGYADLRVRARGQEEPPRSECLTAFEHHIESVDRHPENSSHVGFGGEGRRAGTAFASGTP